MTEGHLLVAGEGSLALAQVVGRGTYRLAVEFRQWIDRMVAKVQTGDVKSIMLDMSRCVSLDSTFMGLMVMLALKVRGRCALLVVNANDEHRQLLDGIGVMRVWRYLETPVESMNWQALSTAAQNATGIDDDTRRLVIEAHETLMDLDEANVPRFKDVVEMMKEDN